MATRLDFDMGRYSDFSEWLRDAGARISEIYSGSRRFYHCSKNRLDAERRRNPDDYGRMPTMEEVRRTHKEWLEKCADMATDEPSWRDTPPELRDVFDERAKYASAIANLAGRIIKESGELTIPQMAVRGQTVQVCTLDILRGQFQLNEIANGTEISELRENGVKSVYCYTMATEKVRYENRPNADMFSVRGAFGSGEIPENAGGSSNLVSNLYDVSMQPPILHLLGRKPEEIDRIRKRTKLGVEQFLEERERKEKEYGREFPPILLEREDVRKRMLEEIRPRKPKELLLGHHLSIEYMEMALGDELFRKNLEKNLERLEEDLRNFGITHTCTGQHTFEVGLTPLLGTPYEKIVSLDTFLWSLNYPTRPIFESLRSLVPLVVRASAKFVTPTNFLKMNPAMTFQSELDRLKKPPRSSTPIV